MVQLIPLPLTVSCSSKIQIGFTFLVPAHPGSPGQRVIKWVCVCVPVNSIESLSASVAKQMRFQRLSEGVDNDNADATNNITAVTNLYRTVLNSYYQMVTTV